MKILKDLYKKCHNRAMGRCSAGGGVAGEAEYEETEVWADSLQCRERGAHTYERRQGQRQESYQLAVLEILS